MKVRVASAGTGKTTRLVLRYLELLASGVPLSRIAGVTFTRVAADELRQRVAEGVRGVQADGQYLGVPFTAGDAGYRVTRVIPLLKPAANSTGQRSPPFTGL